MGADTTPKPDVEAWFHKATSTVSYLVADPRTLRAAVIDPVLDFDMAAGRSATISAAVIRDRIRERGLTLEWILETHVHADHLTAAPYLKRELGGRTAIGTRIVEVQNYFRRVYNLERAFLPDGSQFDRLFADGETFRVGGIEARVLHTPGHTPACVSYVIGDAVFVGDTLFMPDFGTARCDFPGGDAHVMYRSIRRLLDLAPETRVFVGHDYQPGGRAPAWESTVACQRRENAHVGGERDEDGFVALRAARDGQLAMPTLLLPSIQVNIRGGELPAEESNGLRYLKIPIDAL